MDTTDEDEDEATKNRREVVERMSLQQLLEEGGGEVQGAYREIEAAVTSTLKDVAGGKMNTEQNDVDTTHVSETSEEGDVRSRSQTMTSTQVDKGTLSPDFDVSPISAAGFSKPPIATP